MIGLCRCRLRAAYITLDSWSCCLIYTVSDGLTADEWQRADYHFKGNDQRSGPGT